MIIETPKRICVTCKKFLEPAITGFGSGWQYYCSNNKCIRFGLITILWLWADSAKNKAKINA